jgi:hypothetical protein
VTARCPAGHKLTSHGLRRPCAACRRGALIRFVIAAGGSLSASEAAAAVDAVATSPAVLRELAAALAADPDMLANGAPPVAGRLAAELIARGPATLTLPGCARCGRAGMPLYRTPGGGMCKPCTARQITAACAHCGVVKPVVSRDAAGQRICERCRRHDRGHRRCGICGQNASIAVRARGSAPDICVSCYRMPAAVCSVCGKYRVQLRRQRPSGLPIMLAAGHRPLRPLRPGPPAAGALARRAGLRPVLYSCAAAPGTVRILRAATAAGRPARPGR